MADHTRFGFIGAGKMATALATGWLRAGLAQGDDCCAVEPLAEARRAFTEATGIENFADGRGAAELGDVLVLAIKPQDLDAALGDLRPHVGSRHLVLSIAAGVTTGRIADGLPPGCRIIRVMPNVACLVQAGAAGYSAGPSATANDLALVDRLLNAVGRAMAVPESLLDAVTGLSGSGPAFVFTVIEALSDGGVQAGLPREAATVLAAQTVLGAAKLVLETKLHPAVLKDQVASPGGTTIAGLQALERAGLRAGLIDAVAAAAHRSRELGASG